jgi:dynein intermediate chain
MQGLTLSSSFDWSVKLWNPKVSNECFLSFDSAEDYVYDVAFNKSNPSIFASVDGEGFIDLWDLEGDLEVPLVHYKTGNNSLNKLKWNKDGSKMIVGDAIGNVNLYGMEKRVCNF